MGGARYCSQCRTSHEGVTGKKCQLLQQGEFEPGSSITDNSQASNFTHSEGDITGEQARLVAEQVVTSPRATTSTGVVLSSQDIILQELQRISQRFGKLEEKAEEDRQILSGLVVGFNRQEKVVDGLINASQVGQNAKKNGSVQGSAQISQGQNSQRAATSSLFDTNTVVHSKPNNKDNTVVNTIKTRQSTQQNPTTNTLSQSSSQTSNNTGNSVNRIPMSSQISTVQGGSIAMIDNDQSRPQLVTQMTTGSDWSHLMDSSMNNHTLEHLGASAVNQIQMNNTVTYTTSTVPVFSAAHWTANQMQQVQVNQQTGSVNNPATATGFGGNSTQTEGTEHQIIPTIQALKNSADIHRKVNQRYADLEEAVSGGQQGNFENFLENLHKHAQKQAKPKVKWPQDMAFIGAQRKRPTYDQLTSLQWLLGFLRIRQEEQDPAVRENMIDYLTELTQDACDFTWEAAKGAHAVLMHRMNDGVISWSNLAEIHKLRARYAQTTASHSVQEKKTLKVVPCLQYNKGTYQRTGDHEWKNLLLKHMCQFCFNNGGKVENHPKKDCWKGGRDQVKN